MKQKSGWEYGGEGTRAVRDRAHGLWGQAIWYQLQQKGFVTDERLTKPLTKQEEKLKHWLIWGYWEL